MAFTSLEYFLLLFVTVAVSRAVSNEQVFKSLLILSGGIFLAFSGLSSLLALTLLAFLNFFLGKRLSNQPSKFLFFLGIGVNVFAVLISNYFVGFSQLSWKWVHFESSSFYYAMGLSFYSLANIAWLIDCHKQRIQPNGILDWLSFSFFFPKISAGPILIYQDFQWQRASIASLLEGAKRVGLGVFKKMVLADRLAPGVVSIFDAGRDHHGMTLFCGSILFTVQLFLDFSAYSDIAIGSAKMLGIRLPENFQRPFRATSISAFWRNWHISLIDWLTKYVFYPLHFRYRKTGQIGSILAISCVFLLSSIWHGIGLTFVIWGVLHALYSILENRLKLNIPRWAKVFKTFLLVVFSNFFFRINSMERLRELTLQSTELSFFPTDLIKGLIAPLANGGDLTELFNFYISLALATAYFISEDFLYESLSKNNYWLWPLLIILWLVFGIFDSGQQFIYLQF